MLVMLVQGHHLGNYRVSSHFYVSGTLQCGEYRKMKRKHPCSPIANGRVVETEVSV